MYLLHAGTPKPPSNIELSLTNDEQDLLVTWTSESSKLRPITQYRVSVRTTVVDDTKSADIRSRRQSDVEVKEYTTPEERLLLENVESGKRYTIQVCAENDLGHACAEPKGFTISGKDGEPKTLVLISEGLEPPSESSTVVSTLPQGYIIVIILLPCILFLAVCILVISVIICSCSRYNSKHYYPSQQGIINNYRIIPEFWQGIQLTVHVEYICLFSHTGYINYQPEGYNIASCTF
jgi:hypothetical protein